MSESIRERPILFSGPMVRELLAGRKTQTRRPVKPQPPDPDGVRKLAGDDFHLFQHVPSDPAYFGVAGPVWAVRDLCGTASWRCPYGAPGDRLWVRETWAPVDHFWNVEVDPPCSIGYAADRTAIIFDTDGRGRRLDTYAWNWDIVKWKPGIHLRRRDARLFLEVTGVRVEPLQAITEEDARSEGFERREHFLRAWTEMYGGPAEPLSVEADPWVWVVTFRRVEAP